MIAALNFLSKRARSKKGVPPRRGRRVGAGPAFGALLLLAGVVVGAGVLLLARPLPSLLVRARRVTSTAGWDPYGWDGNGPAVYAWLSEREVLFTTSPRPGGSRLVFRRDVTGRHADARFGPMPLVYQPLRAGDTHASPDGRWLLCRDWTNGATHGNLIAVALDGSGRRKTWPAARPGLNTGTSSGVPFWLPSGAGWAWVGRGDGLSGGRNALMVFPFGAAKTPLASAPLPSEAAQNALGLIRQNDDDARQPALLALDNDRSLSPFWFDNQGGDSRFFLLDPGAFGGANRNPALAPRFARPQLRLRVVRPAAGPAGQPAIQRTRPVTLPPGTVGGSVVVSPDGRRLAWLLDTERRSPVAELLARLLPKHPLVLRPPQRSVSLWLSRPDGADFVCVGAYVPPPRPMPAAAPKFVFLADSRPGRLPSRLRWTPNGKRVSFVFDGSLWTVPAD